MRPIGLEDSPLEVLALQLLARAPPSLNALVGRLLAHDGYADFVAVVREFLPERQTEILAGHTPAAQIAIFADRFRDRYFPLPFEGPAGYMDLEYADLLRGVPIIYGGLEWEDLHDVGSWRPGYLLLAAPHIREMMDQIDPGVSIAWFEECEPHVRPEDLRRIPAEGWSAEELYRLLSGTNYEAAALFAYWMGNNTGNPFLDCHAEYPLEEDWEREVVDYLTTQWTQAEAAWGQMHALAEWLEEDLPRHFAVMLDFIQGREAVPAAGDGGEGGEDYSDPC